MTRKYSTLVTALAFVAVAALAASLAQASMTINLRIGATAGGGTSKLLGQADVGTNIPIEVWVAVTNDIVAPAPNAEKNGTGAHEGLGFLAYSVVSTKVGAGIPGAIASPVNSAPFNGTGNQVGGLADLNGDGIGDLGNTADASTNTVVRPRSPAAVYDDGSGTKNAITNGTEWRVTRFNFHVDAVPVGTTILNPVIPSWILGSVKGANWWQDADYDVGTGDGFNNLTYFAGQGVTLIGVPEPGTFALLGLSLVGLVGLVRGRKQRV